MKHGDAERMRDFAEAQGLDFLPWQVEFLRKLEQRAIDEEFVKIIRAYRL